MDVIVYYKGFHGDTSGMALIGEVDYDIRKLVLYVNIDNSYTACNVQSLENTRI